MHYIAQVHVVNYTQYSQYLGITAGAHSALYMTITTEPFFGLVLGVCVCGVLPIIFVAFESQLSSLSENKGCFHFRPGTTYFRSYDPHWEKPGLSWFLIIASESTPEIALPVVLIFFLQQ